MKIKRITIIVPVYNEVKTLPIIYKKLVSLRFPWTKEIIIVDDGSTDGSREFLTKHQRKNRQVKIIFHRENQGKGAAVKTALAAAAGDYVIIQDADLEYHPEEITGLVEHAQKNDLFMVYGTRNGAIKNRYLYSHFYYGSQFLSFLMRLFFRQEMTDPETCYKLVHRDLLRFIDLTEKGFGMEIEISAKIARLKIPWGEVPISYEPRGFAEGKKIRAKDGLRAIYLILRYFFRDFYHAPLGQFIRIFRERAAKKWLYLNKNVVILDAGCGPQAHLAWQLRRHIGSYIGADKLVPDAKIGNIQLIKSDLSEIAKKVKLNSVDLVVGLAIIEHLDNPQKFLKDSLRLLKKNGRLVLTTPAPEAKIILEILAALRLIKVSEIADHKTYFELAKLTRLLKQVGYRVDHAEKFLWGLNSLVVATKP